jgi:hypothetical protein
VERNLVIRTNCVYCLASLYPYAFTASRVVTIRNSAPSIHCLIGINNLVVLATTSNTHSFSELNHDQEYG